MISSMTDISQPGKLEELTAAIRQQVEVDQKSQELREREVRQREAETAALQRKNEIEEEQIEAFRELSQEISELSEKVTHLHTVVTGYTQGYIADHHVPLMDQTRTLHHRIDLIATVLSMIAPEMMRKDERAMALREQIAEMLRSTPPSGVVVNTGDANVKLHADGDMSRMNITGR